MARLSPRDTRNFNQASPNDAASHCGKGSGKMRELRFSYNLLPNERRCEPTYSMRASRPGLLSELKLRASATNERVVIKLGGSLSRVRRCNMM